MADGNNDALGPVEVVPGDMAKLNITYKGEQGDLPDLVTFDMTDGDLKQVASESIRAGSIPGIDADEQVDFTDFVVDRFPAKDAVPFNRLSMRPKTPFGGGAKRLLEEEMVQSAQEIVSDCQVCSGPVTNEEYHELPFDGGIPIFVQCKKCADKGAES
jgi:hypothetical protein